MLFSSQTLIYVIIYRMTVRGSDERSSRIYAENAQHNSCTHKKLKSLFTHSRRLPPAADCGKGMEGLTANELVRFDYSMDS